MKVILVNGSPRKEGNTYLALKEVERALNEEGIDTEIFWVGNTPINDCICCGYCFKNPNKGCAIKTDSVNEFVKKAYEADGFVFGSPTYYAHPTGRIQSFLDRAFYSSSNAFMYKPCASLVVARRGGASSTFDVLNKYATICSMPLISSTYWNMAYGRKPGEVSQDEEGLMTMYNLGRNMAWILKSIQIGKENGIEHPINQKVMTNFIR